MDFFRRRFSSHGAGSEILARDLDGVARGAPPGTERPDSFTMTSSEEKNTTVKKDDGVGTPDDEPDGVRLDDKPALANLDYEGELAAAKDSACAAEREADEELDAHPEVRAVVPEVDDPDMPINTFRMWFLSLIFVLVGSGVNQLFSLRYPGVHLVSLVSELLAFPLGIFLAQILPICQLNPDRKFNIKEHGLIVIASNVSFGLGTSADSTNLVQAARMYGLKFPAGEAVLAVLCCQMLGYGMAGLGVPFLVKPTYVTWPANLSNIALLSSMHKRILEPAPFGLRMTRLRFFWMVFAAAFVWYWFPGLIFTALSYFTWVCWIWPKDKAVNLVFGEVTGMGLLPMTLDWSMIAYNTNPLLSPHWACANVFIGFVVIFWIVAPILYTNNYRYTAYLPFCSDQVYDNTGQIYNAAAMMTGESLDVQKYREYSMPYLPITFLIVYGLSFASLTCILVHVALWHYRDLVQAFKGTGRMDIHTRLNSRYKPVPWWWWAVTLIIFAALSIVLIEYYHTDLPVWGLVLGWVIPCVFFIPCGIVLGVTNVNPNQLNVLSEFIGGYMFEGKPVANMLFKMLSTDTVGQAQFFAQDMKLGHYLHIAPRTLFWVQGMATIMGALTQAGVTIWMMGHVKGICEPDQSNGFVCPNGQTVMSSSVVWGLVGPARIWGVGKIYAPMLHFFWIGALTPFITWALYKKTGWKLLTLVNWPLFWVGMYNVPPATGVNYSSWYVVNVICTKWLFKGFFSWMYAFAAALDSGLAISGIVIFFCVTYGPGVDFPSWWGNTVWQNTADNNGTAWLDLPAKGYFGGPPGSWQ